MSYELEGTMYDVRFLMYDCGVSHLEGVTTL